MTGFADLRLNRLGYARIISKLRAGIEAALLHCLFAAGPTKLKLVREAGIEPARLKHGILSPACLPLSPLPHQACRRRESNSHGLSSPQISKTCVSACCTTPATKRASADPNAQFRCGLSLLNSLTVLIEIWEREPLPLDYCRIRRLLANCCSANFNLSMLSMPLYRSCNCDGVFGHPKDTPRHGCHASAHPVSVWLCLLSIIGLISKKIRKEIRIIHSLIIHVNNFLFPVIITRERRSRFHYRCASIAFSFILTVKE